MRNIPEISSYHFDLNINNVQTMRLIVVKFIDT